MLTLYGIKNCDTVRKARKWLEARGIEYQFHDFRTDGLDRAQLQAWLQTTSPDLLVNRRSTTWKQLEQDQRDLADQGDVIELLLAHPTLIKRPVLNTNKQVLVGFKPEDYQSQLPNFAKE